MSSASPHADVELPDPGPHEFLLTGLNPADLERVVLVSGESLTYGSLSARVDGFAAELVARDLGPGDVVAWPCPNTLILLNSTPAARGRIVTMADGVAAIAGRRAPIAAGGRPVPNTVNKLVDPATGAEIDVRTPTAFCTRGTWRELRSHQPL